mgnify:FL=1
MYELYFSTNGRIPRSTFWTKFVLVFSIIYLIGIGVDISNDSFDQESKIGPFSGILIILSFYPGIAGTIKRAHDRNRSGWFILLSIIPFVNIWVTIELNFLKGTSGDNDYGVDPLSNFDLTKDSKKQGNDQSNPKINQLDDQQQTNFDDYSSSKKQNIDFSQELNSIESKLVELQNLKEKGLIDDGEFSKKRKEYIDKL